MIEEEKREGRIVGELEALRQRMAELTVSEARRRLAEEAMRKIEENHLLCSLYFENVSDIIYSLSPNFIVLSVSPSVERSLGYKPEELIGRPFYELGILTPSSLERAFSDARRVLAGERIHSIEYEFITKSGDRRFGEVSGAPIYQEGKVGAILSVARDVTERKRAEEFLRESEERLRRLAEKAQDMIYRYELVPQPRLTYVSPAVTFLTGHTPKEHYDDPQLLSKLIHPADGPLLEAVLQGIMPPGNFLTLRWVREDGTITWTESRMVPIYDDAGHLVAIEGIARDISERKQAEEGLRESEGRFRGVFDSAPLGMALLGMDGHVLRANQGLCRLLGYSPAEMVAMHLREFTHPEDLDIDIDLREALVKGERGSYWIDKRCVGKHGEILWGRLSVSLLRDDQGRPQCIIIACEDISLRKRAEEALQESEARYRDLFDSANDVILIVDKEGNIFNINKRGEELTGFTHQELIQRNLFQDLIIPEDRETMVEVACNLLAGKKQVFEVRWQAKDKTVIPLEGSSSPSLSEDGQFISARCILRDITSRKQAEEALRQSEERYRAVVDQSPDGIYLLDVGTKCILEANTTFQRMLGYSAEEIRRLSIYDFVAADREDIEQRFQSVVSSQGPSSFERQLRRKDGSLVDVWVSAKVISYGGREIICALARDLTEKKALEAKFLQAQRLESVGLLAAGIAHNLNDILSPILMNAQLLQQSLPEPKAQQMLSSIQSNAQRGAEIVRRILTFSRGIEGERLPLSPKFLLKEVEKFLNQTFPKSIQIETEIQEEIWPLSGDGTQLHQALMNLCVNAKDAMPQGGTLILTAENVSLDETYAGTHPEAKSGPYVLFSISDTGVGIPAQDMEKIFDPFFTTKERGQGPGLGLSTVHGIVEGHGGFIQVYSEVGKGTRFQLYLPSSPSAEVARAEEEEEVPLPSGKGELILVVEDEASVRESIQNTLEAHGYRVITASDGSKAVALYLQHRGEVEAVITDMAMPIMDGPSTIRALQRMNPNIKIIATSGMHTERAPAEASGSAVRSFLPKPFTVGRLLSTLKEVLETKEKTPPSGEQDLLGSPGPNQDILSFSTNQEMG